MFEIQAKSYLHERCKIKINKDSYKYHSLLIHSFLLRKQFHILFSLEISNFIIIHARIPRFPFILFLFINLLNLRIFKRKLQSFYFGLFTFLYILWIIWQDFILLRNLELCEIAKINFFGFLLFILHRAKSMQLNDLL